MRVDLAHSISVVGHKDIPADCDLIVVLTNRGYGWEPKKVLLPHQLYAHDVKRMLAELDGYPDYCEVAYVPIRSSEIKSVANKKTIPPGDGGTR